MMAIFCFAVVLALCFTGDGLPGAFTSAELPGFGASVCPNNRMMPVTFLLLAR
jgi:hypothetical protein